MFAARTFRRPGFTLTELLVTMGISIALIATALPLVKFNLEEGKVREASRQVNAFLAKAKAHAAVTGRVACVWLERDAGNFNRSSNMYLAEVPVPFAGALSNSRVKIQSSKQLDFVLDNGTADPNSPAILAAIFEPLAPGSNFGIRLDYKGPIYTGTAAKSGSTWTFTLDTLPTPHTTFAYPYQLYRPPQRISNQHVELPRATFIDLEQSGIGNTNGQLTASPTGTPPTDTTPVVIAFTPGGSFSGLYAINAGGTPLVPSAALHLLVARQRTENNAPQPIGDQTALWVSIGTVSGSIRTSDNAPKTGGTLADAREFAIKHDIRGGR